MSSFKEALCVIAEGFFIGQSFNNWDSVILKALASLCRKSFCTALRKSGITNFHFHDLRHTFASQLVMAGVDLNTVRDGDITMTLRYAHLAPSYKQRAVDMLVDAL